ncbi:hypothetical protein SCMU_03660 [Sinomonas cyclohexanicum]|uniref:DUF6458 domain-containing protein n=1 Tax=Sinomonas cyclohexanicum TaxID=322009 RepID=A0ABN6FCX7_SINCY|nr:DUF6458 family protein [Corynebacterium cyclohexanicum]BCT74524.1 hypothetical protein SCMU_03660 [Corynebacterium cyclohexanicum]
MGIGASIFLIAVGAILAFAITPGLIPYVDQTLVGYILIGVGVLGLIVSLVMMSTGPRRRVSESRQMVDPDTGEAVTRRDTRDI